MVKVEVNGVTHPSRGEEDPKSPEGQADSLKVFKKMRIRTRVDVDSRRKKFEEGDFDSGSKKKRKKKRGTDKENEQRMQNGQSTVIGRYTVTPVLLTSSDESEEEPRRQRRERTSSSSSSSDDESQGSSPFLMKKSSGHYLMSAVETGLSPPSVPDSSVYQAPTSNSFIVVHQLDPSLMSTPNHTSSALGDDSLDETQSFSSVPRPPRKFKSVHSLGDISQVSDYCSEDANILLDDIADDDPEKMETSKEFKGVCKANSVSMVYSSEDNLDDDSPPLTNRRFSANTVRRSSYQMNTSHGTPVLSDSPASLPSDPPLSVSQRRELLLARMHGQNRKERLDSWHSETPVSSNMNDSVSSYSLPRPPKSPQVADWERTRSLKISSKLLTTSPFLMPQDRVKSLSIGSVETPRTSIQSEALGTGVSVKAMCASFLNLKNNGPSPTERPRFPRKSSLLAGQSVKDMRSLFAGQGNDSPDASTAGKKLIRTTIDPEKVARKFSQGSAEAVTSLCRKCEKQVFQMEMIKAEKASWHKKCFRCKECDKQLSVDTYQSHEGQLYCKPHFRQIFQPKAVEDNFMDSTTPQQVDPSEVIIRENVPMELPSDVVRSSSCAHVRDFEELASSVDLKSRFMVFEKVGESGDDDNSPNSNVPVKRSPSILSKMAKFNRDGLPDDFEIPEEEEESSEEEEDNEQDPDVIRNRYKVKEEIKFEGMSDLKSKWEGGEVGKNGGAEKRKEEITRFRQMVCRGKQSAIKEQYQQAVLQSENLKTPRDTPKDIVDSGCKSIRERFEKGEIQKEHGEEETTPKEEEMKILKKADTAKTARNLFKELDASAHKQENQLPRSTSLSSIGTTRRWGSELQLQTSPSAVIQPLEIVRSSDKPEEVTVETESIANKFRYFETFKEPERQKREFRITPPREGQVKEPSPEPVTPASVQQRELPAQLSDTTRKMLSKFRELESKKEEVPEGIKPIRRITPPPEYYEEEASEEEEEEEESEEESDSENNGADIQVLRELQRARSMREKFENWEKSVENNNQVNLLESEFSSIERTGDIRARFESLGNEKSTPKATPRVKRFVAPEPQPSCYSCHTSVYPMEMLEAFGHVLHKTCLKCSDCKRAITLNTVSLLDGAILCEVHHKQKFLAKGRYTSSPPKPVGAKEDRELRQEELNHDDRSPSSSGFSEEE
ncbi:unnamed protein product [Cyprideis torosa]|uniref:Uncharacterized protein n=1 Tax=Cyprideis torosa TaxID=163714 RepID=A0A7R8WBC7_9CRUS|nr:unnamed protein product [Cyprideis torosa]CAG0886285.1 unnamed protein product [Cyprideis torosa]